MYLNQSQAYNLIARATCEYKYFETTKSKQKTVILKNIIART